MGVGEKHHCGILRRVCNPQTVSGVTVWSLRALAACNIQGFIIIPVSNISYRFRASQSLPKLLALEIMLGVLKYHLHILPFALLIVACPSLT